MYGSAMMRTYYGAGDYNRAYTFAQGYYAGGGFFSSIGKAIKRVAAPVAKVVSNPLVSTALSFVPGGGIISKGIGLAGKVLSSPVGKVASTALAVPSAIAAGKSLYGAARGLVSSPVAKGLGIGASIGVGQEAVRRTRRRRKSSKRTRRAGNVTVNVTGRGATIKRGGAHKRRRRRGKSGQRVSFRTKDGRTVTFTRK